MQVLKEEIRMRILHAAVESFYVDGFAKSKMKTIAEHATIPVGLVYSYYKSKKDLLDAVVMPVYRKITTLLRNESAGNNDTHYFFETEIPFLIDLLETDRKQAVILIDKCAGTKYEAAKDEFINLAKTHIKNYITSKKVKDMEVKDDLFHHMLATNLMESFFEITRHYKDAEWAKKMIALLAQYHFYGLEGL
jgi:AcrR family transcriptional regulator